MIRYLFPMPTALPAGVAEMSPAEKLQLVEDLWDALATNGADLPLTPVQRKVLRAERRAIRRNPAEGSTWPEVKARLLRGK